MGELVYRNPRDNLLLGNDPFHTIELVYQNVVIGGADIHYYAKPFPLYQLSDLYVDYDKQGKGYGTQIMTAVECMLRQRKKAGVLVDAMDDSATAKGMYIRRGWQVVPDGLGMLLAYNIPKTASLQQLVGYSNRYTPVEERVSWQRKLIIK